jgi:HSP20 family protein
MKNIVSFKRKKAIDRHYSIDPFIQIQKNMDNIIERFFEGGSLLTGDTFKDYNWYPKIDIAEGKDKITVNLEIPGVDSKDLDIKLDGRFLTIKGEKKNEKKEKDDNYYHMERSYGYFNRKLELPADVLESDVDALYKKGILTIKLKKTEEAQAKKIEIKTA